MTFIDQLTCFSGFFVVKFLGRQVVIAVSIHFLITFYTHISLSLNTEGFCGFFSASLPQQSRSNKYPTRIWRERGTRMVLDAKLRRFVIGKLLVFLVLLFLAAARGCRVYLRLLRLPFLSAAAPGANEKCPFRL